MTKVPPDSFSGYVRTEQPAPEVLRRLAIDMAVDNYILMERKAQAWDRLRASLQPSEARVAQLMDQLVSG